MGKEGLGGYTITRKVHERYTQGTRKGLVVVGVKVAEAAVGARLGHVLVQIEVHHRVAHRWFCQGLWFHIQVS